MNLQLIDPTPEYFGKKIRVLVDTEMNNAPWFVAADVCRVLSLNKNTANHLRKLDPADVTDLGVNSINTIKWKGSAPRIVNESGFYELVLGSRKPSAVTFKRWVCSEVLPSIRKYGQYTAYADDNGSPIDVPEVMVEMVKLTERLPNGNITETAPRLHIWEWCMTNDIEGLSQQYRAALGKICRRLMLTHSLPIVKTWRTHKRYTIKQMQWGNSNVYPLEIIEMAYQEYLAGRRD